jgi:ribosomal protein L21E
MPNFKAGDRVRIVSRDQTDADVKSGLYFVHYAGLTGTVLKVYGTQEVSVEIEIESLSRDIRKRHEDVRNQMKTKWLDGLSEEGRSKLTEREKDFLLRYVVLVTMADLEKAGTAPPTPTTLPKPAIAALTAEETVAVVQDTALESATLSRATLADLDAAEQAELLRRAQNGTQSES